MPLLRLHTLLNIKLRNWIIKFLQRICIYFYIFEIFYFYFRFDLRSWIAPVSREETFGAAISELAKSARHLAIFATTLSSICRCLLRFSFVLNSSSSETMRNVKTFDRSKNEVVFWWKAVSPTWQISYIRHHREIIVEQEENILTRVSRWQKTLNKTEIMILWRESLSDPSNQPSVESNNDLVV